MSIKHITRHDRAIKHRSTLLMLIAGPVGMNIATYVMDTAYGHHSRFILLAFYLYYAELQDFVHTSYVTA